MKRTTQRRRSWFRDLLRRGLGRRFFALSMAALICLGLFQTPALATEANKDGTQPSAPVATGVTVSRMDEKPSSAGRAMTNTYLLEVSTGSLKRGREIDNIEYFAIYYRTKHVQGGSVSYTSNVEVVFPELGAIKFGMNLAASIGNRNSRRTDVENYFGYTTDPLENQKALRGVSTDQFLIQTKEPMDIIDKIQIFGHKSDQATDWSCQYMHLYRVDKLYGQEMYGWYSSEGYIDFQGEIIADVVMANGAGNFKFSTTGNVFNLTPPGAGGSSGVLLANVESKDDARLKNNLVGMKHDSQVTNRLTFRLDLADLGKAGFDCLAGSYAAGAQSKVSSLHFCEAAAMTIRYKDVYGGTREIKVPLIVSSLGWTMEKANKDLAICGFAQQGDSIPVSLMLPDYAEYVSSSITLGESSARAKTGLKTSSKADKTLRPSRVEKADTETISYICYAIYRDVSVFIPTNTAILNYEYTPGEKEPGKHYTAGGSMGVTVDISSDATFSLIDYYDGMRLRPVDNSDRYLISISTDNVSNAGTQADIYIQFKYINKSDKEVKSAEYSLREYIQQFYGDWPGNVNDFAYRYGLREAGTVQFMISLPNVKQFKSVSFKIKGKDEWQFKGVKIQKIISKPPPSRTAVWEEIDAQGLKSHIRISRPIDADSPIFTIGTVYKDEASIVDPEDDAWQPGNLVQDDAKYHEYGGSSQEIVNEDVDWENLKYYMTYEDTEQDLGFTRERCNYEVTVFVAKNKTNEINDDCGSENLFYFQLIFEDGKSGCVLANQQLPADAFRTSAEATFYISTNRDLGELESIRIIPDDQDDNGNIYDKLKIEKITVARKSTGMISPTWIADSDDEDGLGWVGIDYRDPGTAGSNQGTEGRTVSEISRVYQITKTSYKTKLLISISTATYSTDDLLDGSGNMVPVTDAPLKGGMTATINYFDYDGNYQTVDSIDVIKLMNEYSATENKYVRSIDGKTEQTSYAVSDTKYQFRGGKADNFFVEVDNIKSILDMELNIRSDVNTYWNIQNITVHQVQGPGARYINGNGEYDYKYPANQGLSYRCSWNRPQGLRQKVDIYHSDDENSIATINVTFNDNTFPQTEAERWNTVIKREPDSKDDTLNLFIYPSIESAASDTSTYSLKSEVLYTDTLTHSPLRVATGKMKLTTDSNGRPVYYALDLGADYFESFSGVEVKTDSVRPVHVPISYAVLQRVRSGVLIDSYYLIGSGNADLGITLNTTPYPTTPDVQRLMLQVDDSTSYQQLIRDERDLAVALTFTTDYVGSGELRTKYVYLTDLGIASVQGGQVLEIDFNILNLNDVVAINLVAIGRLEIDFESGVVLNQTPSGTVSEKWCFRSKMTPTRTPIRVNANGVTSLLDVDITTAIDEGTVTSGTKCPIRMTVGYLTESGGLMTKTFDDISEYMTGDNSFSSGKTDHVRLVIQDMAALRYIELEPWVSAESEQTVAAWMVQSLSAMKDLSGFSVSRMLNKLVREGEPLRVSLADILVSGLVNVVTSSEDPGSGVWDYSIPASGAFDLVLNAGEGVRVMPEIEGSLDDVDISVNRYDPATGGLGRADLVDTRGYTPEVLQSFADAAEAKGYYAEAAVWRSIVPDDGYWAVEMVLNRTSARYEVDYAVFIPPHNYTGSPMYYRITITSVENSSAIAYINLTVPSEPNPVEDLLDEAQQIDLPNHEHNMVFTGYVAPTCTTEGHTEYWACAVCGNYFADALGNERITLESTILPMADHVYGSYNVSEGGHYRTCTVCGASEPVQEHSFTDTVTEPTLTEQGYTTHVCTVCGYTFKDSFVAPIQRLFTVRFTVPDGMTAPGSLQSNQDTPITLPTVTAPAGHKFLGWTTEEYDHVQDKPEQILTGSFTATEDTRLYALFADDDEFEGTFYKKVTGETTDFDGRFVITAGRGADLYVLAGTTSGTDYDLVREDVTYLPNTGIQLKGAAQNKLTDVDDRYLFDFIPVNNVFSIRSVKFGTYLSTTNSWLYAADTADPEYGLWAISVDYDAALGDYYASIQAHALLSCFIGFNWVMKYFYPTDPSSDIVLWQETIVRYTTKIG